MSTLSVKSGEPPSPALSDISMEECGFDTGELLGAGSLASVYKVTRRSDCQQFAAKYVYSEEPDKLDALRNEYELLKMLVHDSVVSVTQLYEGPGDAWLCMELCKGGCVESHVMRHGAFSEQMATNLARQLLEGVGYLHKRRICHRDIKPMNLLLHEDATSLKIGDFNSATRLRCRTGSSVMLSARGTPLYSAPELRFGLQWNERIDVWASGLSIYFMVRAQQPFSLANRQSARLLQQGCLPPIDWGGSSKLMVNLVRQCLVVEMRDRPSPVELLEHAIFSDSTAAAMGTTAASSTTVQHLVLTSLASCGLLMHSLNNLRYSIVQRQSRHQPTMRDLALRRYLSLEGSDSSLAQAWTSPI